MQNVTVRLRSEMVEELDAEAEQQGVSRSEYIRTILDERHRADELDTEIEELRDRLQSREDRIEELEEQLARRSQIEEKVEAVALQVSERDPAPPFPVRWYRWWTGRDD